ncbi:MAG: glycerate kinase [Halobacteriales archaeon]
MSEPTIRNRDELATTPAATVALDCLLEGIRAADPAVVVRDRVGVDGTTLRIDPIAGDTATYDLDDYEEVLVLGGGNAAGRVAAALEAVLGDRIDGGVVVTDDPRSTARVTVREGTHPIPSADNVEGASEILERAEDAGEGTLILAPITGGGSALLAAPARGIDLDDLRAVTDDMLRAGLSIDRINAVRKHLSAIKGGGLARVAAPATVVGLLFSDVIGDDASVIASGPTAPDETTFSDARAALEEGEISPPESVARRLERGIDGEVPETADPASLAGERCRNYVLANGYTAMAAAHDRAADAGYDTLILSPWIRGEARDAAAFHAAVAESCLDFGEPVEPPAVVVSGGETTVTVEGDGRGGPNLEFALAAALELDVGDPVTVASVDTDGIDGNTEVAGALVSSDTVDGGDAARDALERNDAYTYLAEGGATIEMGATGTNVNDLRVIILAE